VNQKSKQAYAHSYLPAFKREVPAKAESVFSSPNCRGMMSGAPLTFAVPAFAPGLRGETSELARTAAIEGELAI